MRKVIVLILGCFTVFISNAQEEQKESEVVTDSVFKKRVLEKTEVDFLMSYYTQEGTHSAVGGGIGNEELKDITPTIVVSLPLNDDDVLTVDAGISAYTSASSSNLNPFDQSGASADDEDDNNDVITPAGSPWVESSGASGMDALATISVDYSHSSDDRNKVWNAHAAFAVEYDYYSIGFGGGHTWLFNEKNTELGIKGNVYLDQWKTLYPTELSEYANHGANFLNSGYFNGVNVYDQNGVIDPVGYNPDSFNVIADADKKRNTYAVSLSFSQILSKRLQASFFFDLIQQDGLLSSPLQRVYFSDKANYYIGQNVPFGIANYTNSSNTTVFQLADDIERMPTSRFKIPVGTRLNYFINEYLVLRTYYRFYSDDWGVSAHTASLELPIKVSRSFAIIPSYRYYTQTAADYFAPYEQHVSTDEFYTSDYDLSDFSSNQLGIGLRYTDIFAKTKIFKFGLKTINLKYSNYSRSDGLNANIISGGFKFVFD